MKGITALSPTKNNLKQLLKASWGPVATTIPKKQKRNESRVGGVNVDPKEKADPIVVFSGPPPIPPVIGPLIVLSLLDNWSIRDGSDD